MILGFISNKPLIAMVKHVLVFAGPTQPCPAVIDSLWSGARAKFSNPGDDCQVSSLGIKPMAAGSLPIIASKAISSDRL